MNIKNLDLGKIFNDSTSKKPSESNNIDHIKPVDSKVKMVPGINSDYFVPGCGYVITCNNNYGDALFYHEPIHQRIGILTKVTKDTLEFIVGVSVNIPRMNPLNPFTPEHIINLNIRIDDIINNRFSVTRIDPNNISDDIPTSPPSFNEYQRSMLKTNPLGKFRSVKELIDIEADEVAELEAFKKKNPCYHEYDKFWEIIEKINYTRDCIKHALEPIDTINKPEHIRTYVDPETILISDLKITVRPYNVLNRSGYHTVADIIYDMNNVSSVDEFINNHKNMGKKMFADILNAIKEKGVDLPRIFNEYYMLKGK